MEGIREMTEPIFEVIDGDKHYKIYENGRIEGFPSGCTVINGIPIKIAEICAHFFKRDFNKP